MINNKNDIKNVFALAAAFLILFIIFRNIFLVYISLFLLLVASLSSVVADIVSLAMAKISFLLASTISKLLLASVFFFVLTPIALVVKNFNKFPLFSKKNSQDTFYLTRHHCYNKEDFENMW